MDILSSLSIDPNKILYYVMAFLRIATLFFFLPIFGDQAVPIRLKISISIVICFFVYPIINPYLFSTTEPIVKWGYLDIVIVSLRELLFAFCIGFSTKIVFYAVSIGSHLAGLGMGFQSATIFNPTIGTSESSYSLLKNWLVIMLFLSTNMHHYILENIVNSFSTVPIGSHPVPGEIAKVFTLEMAETFTLGVRLAAPLLAVQIILNISIGLLNRAIPALNVFMISFPFSFIACMAVLLISAPSLISFVAGYSFEREISWIETTRRAFKN